MELTSEQIDRYRALTRIIETEKECFRTEKAMVKRGDLAEEQTGERARALLKWTAEHVDRLWPQIEILAARLLKHKTLSGDELRQTPQALAA
jgi:hypothetical protein